jgi:phosphatidate cytidylyltransferase
MTETDAVIKPKWKNLGVRIGSAVVLVLICLAPFYFGGLLWAVLAGLFGARMLYEWVRMSDPEAGLPEYMLPIIGLVVGIVYIAQGETWLATLSLVVTLLGVAVVQFARKAAPRLGWTEIGMLYVIVPTLMIVALRGNEVGFDSTGFGRLVFIVICVVAADVGAYFGGSIMGGPKLAPRISPNKTWSGMISGQVFAIVLGAIVGAIVGIGATNGALLALPVALLSVVGDLFESGVKRRLGVKDTGDLMPGHGGLLDRMDGLMAAVFGATLVLTAFPAIWPG